VPSLEAVSLEAQAAAAPQAGGLSPEDIQALEDMVIQSGRSLE
jgi:hypothetical protein